MKSIFLMVKKRKRKRKRHELWLFQHKFWGHGLSASEMLEVMRQWKQVVGYGEGLIGSLSNGITLVSRKSWICRREIESRGLPVPIWSWHIQFDFIEEDNFYLFQVPLILCALFGGYEIFFFSKRQNIKVYEILPSWRVTILWL